MASYWDMHQICINIQSNAGKPNLAIFLIASYNCGAKNQNKVWFFSLFRATTTVCAMLSDASDPLRLPSFCKDQRPGLALTQLGKLPVRRIDSVLPYCVLYSTYQPLLTGWKDDDS